MSTYTIAVRFTDGLVTGEKIPNSEVAVSAVPKEEWIKVKETSPGVYALVESSMAGRGELYFGSLDSLGFAAWDETIEDLDGGNSDAAEFRLAESTHLRCKGIILDLGFEEFRAPSIDKLRSALEHVVFTAFCSADI